MPVVLVREACFSACVPVLASLNRLAKEHVIDLVIDTNATIGFHGAHEIVGGRYSPIGTISFLDIFMSMGGRMEWFLKNADLFESNQLIQFLSIDSTLKGSGILESAVIGDTDYWLMAFRREHYASRDALRE